MAALLELRLGDFPSGAAEGIGFEFWCVVAPNARHFWCGVPLGNFFGWMAAIAGFFAAVELLERWLSAARRGSLGPLASLLVVRVLAGALTEAAMRLYGALTITARIPEWIPFGTAVAVPVGIVVRMWPRVVRSPPLDGVAVLVPAYTFAFAGAAFLLAGVRARAGTPLRLALLAIVPVGLSASGRPEARARRRPGRRPPS